MADPKLNLYNRPIYKAEVDSFGDINLSDYMFNLGVYVTNINKEYVSIPASVGRLTMSNTKDRRNVTLLPLVSCKDLFNGNQVNQTDSSIISAIEYGACLDPSLAAIKGSTSYGIEQFVEIGFNPCLLDEEIDKSECLDEEDLKAWMRENKVKSVSFIYSFNFIDFEEEVDPIQQGAQLQSFEIS